MLLSLLYRLMRCFLGLFAVLVRSDLSKDVELLVLRQENQVLRRQAGGRPRWDHTDRLWITALSRLVNRRRWAEIFPVTAATISRWHRHLVARKWTFTIACDFLVVETVLLQRLYVLVFIEHGTPRLHLGGVTAHPTGAWAVQQARNVAMEFGDRLETLRFLIHDRDPLFTAAFGEVFKSEGLRIIATLPQTPRMNAICERVIETLRRELLDRILILGERHLALVLREYLIHYNGHRHINPGSNDPQTSRHSRSVMWPTCDPYAENPSSRE